MSSVCGKEEVGAGDVYGIDEGGSVGAVSGITMVEDSGRCTEAA